MKKYLIYAMAGFLSLASYAINPDGRTILHNFSFMGHTDIVREILDKGENVDVRTHSGHTALHLASKRGHTDTANLLLERRRGCQC